MGESTGGRLKFLPDGISTPISPGETILAHALKSGVALLSPCGGEGRCGKCRVAVAGESLGGDDPGFLSKEERREGVRLACRCAPLNGDLDVTVLPESRPAKLSAYIEGREMEADRKSVV
jgi:ferredoxin